MSFGKVARRVAAALITADIVLLVIVALAGGASAGEKCPRHTACDAARIAANMADYNGPLAPTTGNMVCLHVVAHEPSALVLANGDQPYGAPVAGHVLTRWRTQSSGHWKPWPGNPRYVYREICFGEALLRQGNSPGAGFRSALTLCNGVYVDQPLRNRSVWRRSKGYPQHLSRVKRIGPEDATCLLGEEECVKYGL